MNVFGMFDGGESMPLAGEEKTTLSDAPEPPPFEVPGKVVYYSTIYILSHCITMPVLIFKAVSPVCYVSGQQQSNNGDCII